MPSDSSWRTIKKLLGIDIDLGKLEEIKLVSGNSLDAVYKKIDNSKHLNLTININSSGLNEESKRLLQGAIRGALEQSAVPILEENAAIEIDQIASANLGDDEVYTYFVDKIPEADRPILLASLYIRRQYRAGHTVEELKQQLRDQHGERGNNISNLCTGGYFESYLKPMYEELSTRPNFVPSMFIDSYEVIIKNEPFVVFVNRSHSHELLLNEIISKLERNRMYGMHKLDLHALGQRNVKMLQEVISDKLLTKYFTTTPNIEIQGGLMHAEVYY